MGYALLCGDALEIMRADLKDNSIDLIITDPPYKSLEEHRARGTTTRLVKSWFPVLEDAVLLEHAREWLRVLKPGRHLYMMCDPKTSYALVPALLAMGWRWGNRLIWDKKRIGMGYHYRRRYEDILFLTKPATGGHKKRKLRDLGVPDVIDTVPAVRKRGAYPTQKPIGLASLFMFQSGNAGETVLDPFCGSGSTVAAAISGGMHGIGIDVQEQAIYRAGASLRDIGGAELSWKEFVG